MKGLNLKGPWGRSLIAIIILLLVSLACQFPSVGSRIFGSKSEPRIIFADDFQDTTSGWNRAVTASGISDYADGAYRIFVNEVYTDIWSARDLNESDLSIEVDALKVGGERNNRFGVICRNNGNSFYTFLISSDGYYGIGKTIRSETSLIGMATMRPSEAINQGTALNRLRADCIGNNLAFYVNGELVNQVQDSEFTSGNIGLIAGSYDVPGTDILFDNIIVSVP